MTIQTVSRKCTFDYGHRVMHENLKCFNIHGHLGNVTLTFKFNQSEEIGYAIDFKEIKRVGCQWIDDTMDHAMLLNPHDTLLIETTRALKSKLWLMSLNGEGEYCNPSVENVTKEIFLAMEILFPSSDSEFTGLEIHKVKVYETPNCFTTVKKSSITDQERENFRNVRYKEIYEYYSEKGKVEYDSRKLSCNM